MRFLLFCFFTLHALFYVPEYNTKGVIIVLSALYISLSLVAHFYPWKLRGISNYIDYVFVLPLALLSKEPMAVFALIVPALYTFPKDIKPFIVSLSSATALLFLFIGTKGLLFSLLVLALGLSPSSIDLLRSLQKERRYIAKLREAYRSVQHDLLILEREKIEKERLIEVLRLLDRDTPEEYLRGIKDMFNLKAIKLLTLSENSPEKVLIDHSNMTFSVPVSLEHGKASVVFYVNHPAELMDESLKENLVQCAKLLRLYISGFEDNLSKEQIKIAV
ncbi:hypothetical protein [Thermocrinis sp.]